ncbi:MAG: hypothetical protein WBX38_09510 [Candidatus Sulfotelmatobacter sp.]
MPPKQLDKEDILLLLLSAMAGSGAKEKVSSITRIEKMMFLLQRETAFSGLVAGKFSFKPWKFGPFSQEIYEDLDLLSSLELVNVEERELASYVDYTEEDDLIGVEQEDEPVVEKVFSLTDRGKRVAEKLRTLLSDSDWLEVLHLKKRFEGVPLTRLIQYVYQKYPETTEKSVLEHLKPRQLAH